MSDYLSNLVDRGLDRADVIQPRLPSLFEPAQGIGSPMPGLWQEAEPMTEIIEQSAPEARTPRSVIRQPSPIARMFDRVLNRRSPESDSIPQLPPSTAMIEVSPPRLQPLSEVAQTGPVDRLEPAIAPPFTIQPLSLQPQITAPQTVPSSVSVEQSAIASQTTSDRERSIESTIDNPDQLPSWNPMPISVRDKTDQSKPASLPADLTSSYNPQIGRTSESTTIEQIRSVIQAIEPEVVSAPDRSAVPTIQVTIGRIEVRATTTAPATPAANQARSKPPVMSLDEYLNQRGGGR